MDTHILLCAYICQVNTCSEVAAAKTKDNQASLNINLAHQLLGYRIPWGSTNA